jgi:hypothetical protein
MRRALWLVLPMLWLAFPTLAEVRRVEVVGVAPAGAGAQSGVPVRQRALGAALAQGVEGVARELLSEEAAADPALDLGRVLAGNPREFTVGYKVLEDRGERRPLLLVDPDVSSEYVLLVEVFVDVARVEAALEAAGLRVRRPVKAPNSALRVTVEALPSYQAYAALRRHLMGLNEVSAVTPESFEAGRVELRVEGRLTPPELVDRLLNPPPDGLRVESVFADGQSVRIRIAELPGFRED